MNCAPRVLPPLTVFTLAAVACASPLEAGEYLLEGEALLEVGSGPQPRTESMTLFVDSAGQPTHLHDHRYDDAYVVTFADGAALSDDLCERDGCELRVERASGCAVWSYDEFFRPRPGSDSGVAYTGEVRACPTGEQLTPTMTVGGLIDPTTLMPDGALEVAANYPLDPARDSFRFLVDGVPRPAEFSPGSFRHVFELGVVPVGSRVELSYTGAREVSPVFPSPISTVGSVSDLSFDSAPPAGAIDARGQTPTFEDGDLVVRDEGDGRARTPFTVAIALPEPGGSTQLELDMSGPVRSGSNTQVQLVRADGSASDPHFMNAPIIDLPPGTGQAWLVFTNPQDLGPPNDRIGTDLVFRLHGLRWL